VSELKAKIRIPFDSGIRVFGFRSETGMKAGEEQTEADRPRFVLDS
jgi:hypothetical protein